jgi:hypothetical protein
MNNADLCRDMNVLEKTRYPARRIQENPAAKILLIIGIFSILSSILTYFIGESDWL